MENKVFRYIGLAKRGGMLTVGAEAVINCVRGKSTFLVIIALDASKTSVKKISDKCKYYNIPFISYGTAAALGSAVGKSAVACVSVNDKKFAGVVMACVQAETGKE